jgi:hypothetical protein
MHPTYVHHLAGSDVHGGAMVIALVIWLAVFAAVLLILLRPPRDHRDGADGDSGPGGRGRGPGGGGPDPPQPTGDDPAWWPEFERELAEYVSTRHAPTGSRRALRPAPPSV